MRATRAVLAAAASPHPAEHFLAVRMPKLSPTMTHGSLHRWLKQPGDPVDTHDLLYSLQTRSLVQPENAIGKFAGSVTMLVESSDINGYRLGRLLRHAAPTPLPIGELLAILCETPPEATWLATLPEPAVHAFAATHLTHPDRHMTYQAFTA
mmetsp:Transcript_50351/g.123787  ORF Transcript_50351/g.123787 Transcript_50351/m.123787 type:complete len:152 (-) Transcript_50351:164-619(-)